MKKTQRKQNETVALPELDNINEPEDILHLPLRRRTTVSGLYRGKRRVTMRQPMPIPDSQPKPIPASREPFTSWINDTELTSTDDLFPGVDVEDSDLDFRLPWFEKEEIRLDVDGPYPQSVVSGTIRRGFRSRIHWIANLKRGSGNIWVGPIWHKEGNTGMLPQTTVVVKVVQSLIPNHKSITVEFGGVGLPSRIRSYRFISRYFHKVEFEFDHVAGVTPVTNHQTHSHPNHPLGIQSEMLTIKRVYQRSGFDVSISSGASQVPVAIAGQNKNPGWSDSEMHDAMQAFWSRFQNHSQWATWVLFANRHEMGSQLGGIMFDSLGSNNRQGTALFNDSFISTAPPGDENPAAWVNRMRFWTVIHELGQGFNLAHSWQKQHPSLWGTPWNTLTNEAESRSFTNYPYNVTGGQEAFFSDFQFRFSNSELLFMRHAPERFMKMGGAEWFDNHGFEGADLEETPSLHLETRVNRSKAVYEFLEPVNIEIKLTNVSDRPQLVDENIINRIDNLTIVTKRENDDARQMLPFAHYCREPKIVALKPTESLHSTVMVSVGSNGWNIDDAGRYVVQVCLHHDGKDIVSQRMQLTVYPAQTFDQGVLAQDLFNEDVGRILTFGGSRFLDDGINTLKTITEKFPETRVARHAGFVLGKTMTRNYKMLNLEGGLNDVLCRATNLGGMINITEATIPEGLRTLAKALDNTANGAIDTFGHINFKNMTDEFTDLVHGQGDATKAVKVQETMLKTMTDRKVADPVLVEIMAKIKAYGQKTKKATS